MNEGRRRGRVGWRKKLVVGAGVFVFLTLLITSIFGRKGLLEMNRAKKDYQDKVEQVRRLERDRERLVRQIRELERNPKAVEPEARERIWLVKPDEKVIVKKAEAH
jgi:cell division protein FtsB